MAPHVYPRWHFLFVVFQTSWSSLLLMSMHLLNVQLECWLYRRQNGVMYSIYCVLNKYLVNELGINGRDYWATSQHAQCRCLRPQWIIMLWVAPPRIIKQIQAHAASEWEKQLQDQGSLQCYPTQCHHRADCLPFSCCSSGKGVQRGKRESQQPEHQMGAMLLWNLIPCRVCLNQSQQQRTLFLLSIISGLFLTHVSSEGDS